MRAFLLHITLLSAEIMLICNHPGMISTTPAGAGPDPAPAFSTGFLDVPPAAGEYKVVVLEVIDADTIKVGFILPVSLRIVGVNAPEKNTPRGKAAKAQVQEWLPTLPPAQLIDCRVMVGDDKFGRKLGDVLLPQRDFMLSKKLLDEGLAKRWDGRGPRP